MGTKQNTKNENSKLQIDTMLIGIAADHGGYELKVHLISALTFRGYQVKDFGADVLNLNDDYPDFVIPLARAVSKGEITKGLAICGSGVGACMVANKISGVRAALISDCFSAHQGVEDDNMNIICLGGRVIGSMLAWELVKTFLAAEFNNVERHRRRLSKVNDLDMHK